MDKIICKILSVFAAVAVLVCSSASVLSVNAENPSSNAFNGDMYYGRSALSSMENGDLFLEVYDALYTGISVKDTEIDLTNLPSGKNVMLSQLEMIHEMYYYDHPEHYWVLGSYSAAVYPDQTVAYLYPDYASDFDSVAFERSARVLLSAAEGKTSDFDKALALHDALVKYTAFVSDAANVHSSYGAIVEGQAVCEGYAKAYQYLLQREGIQSYIVTGIANGQSHAWNLVRLDGKYYYTDVTWDDPVTEGYESLKPVYYTYFNITTALLLEDHTISDTYSILPECVDTDKMYGGYTVLDAYDANSVAAAFSGNGIQTARIYYSGSSQDNFADWFKVNLNAVFSAMSVSSGGSFNWSNCGREHYLTFTPSGSGSEVAGRTKCSGSADIKTTVVLTSSDGAGRRYETSFYGNFDVWKITDVAAGSYTVTLSKEGHRAETSSIEVGSGGAVFDADIFLVGDVTRDGTADIRDLARFKKSLAASSCTDLFDVNYDGKVNADDLTCLIPLILYEYQNL